MYFVPLYSMQGGQEGKKVLFYLVCIDFSATFSSSQHDFPNACMRSHSSNGHYIMHPNKGVQGFLESNYQFSSCSIKNISISLASLKSFGRQCMGQVPASVCGNGLIEAWEECDCGEDYQDCSQACTSCIKKPAGQVANARPSFN